MKGQPEPPLFMKNITILKHRVAVQKALDTIETRVKNIPTLGELASVSGLSRTYFCQVFREITGTRLQDYVIQARLNRARDLLSNINLEIKEIAHEVGFRDPNHFSRTFKKKMRISPTDWRVSQAVGNSREP